MNYYRKPINKVVDDVKLKMQIGALTLKISENNNKIDDLIGVDKNIKKDIISNTTKIDNFQKYLISSKIFKKSYNIEKQVFRFNKDTHFFQIFEEEIEHDFTIDSLLIITNHINYKYNNLKNYYYIMQHEYSIYNKDDLIHTYIFNHDKYYNENLDPFLSMNEDFCIRFKNNYKKIKIILDLHRHNRHGVGNINLEIDDNSSNYINIDYLDKNNISLKIEKNKSDIAHNLNELNYIKNKISKSYLKNVYNILYYNIKQKIDLNNNFYNKTFELNAKKMIL